ncbi:MAG TPA: phage tail sheath subtilisin-like domain-containing protein [Terriglobia bacterium]|nr:phage tail sheath subtilisin-like domain-containing protein [Terriglobia bacterium]
MPEYLAPGVYVEETSFRAKSIEGVGTSTTAFVGPTRRGPIASIRLDAFRNPPAPPEMLTSFGDFVRIYGGLDDLPLGGSRNINYLGHAVLNFFNEGGTRLYVARVANGAVAAARAISGDLTDPNNTNRIFIRARFPGESGNGAVTVREILSTGTRATMEAAPADTLVRAHGSVPSEPARISGGTGEHMSVPDGSVLRVMLNRVARNVRFRGARTEAESADALPNPVVLTDQNNVLRVTLDGRQRVVTLDPGSYTPAQLALAINERLEGGYARLKDGKLVIGTDRRGHSGRVQVEANPAFRFTQAVDQTGQADPVTNNLPDLANFNAADLNLVLDAQIRTGGGQPEVTSAQSGGRLVISTVAFGENQSLAIADATDPAATPPVVSAHAALGFSSPVPGDEPVRGSNVRVYRKQAGGQWQDASNNQLSLPQDPVTVVGNQSLSPLFISVIVTTEDADGETEAYDEVSLVGSQPRYLGRLLGPAGNTRADGLQRLFAFDIGNGVDSLELHAALFPEGRTTGDIAEGLSAVHRFSEGTLGTQRIRGTNGGEPTVGVPTEDGTYRAALEQLRGLEDISIIAAPGHSAYNTANYRAIQLALLSHVALPRAYRIAVLDTPPTQLPSEARAERAQIDSTRAAIYYPWVTVANPLARPGRDDIPREINLPPSGFICGIYARNDVEQTVAKAPANEVVRGALRFESDVNFAQNQLLNPLGVNCLRFFPGRGFRVWGARTAGSDPEIKYVNVRRYFLYLEASIDRGTQWAVFENNGPRLWVNIRETVEAFLYNEWVSGNLLGADPKQAFFVRCDRTTMTQNDLDNGRLICLVGVAMLKPAEFVIFRIGQKTADARS